MLPGVIHWFLFLYKILGEYFKRSWWLCIGNQTRSGFHFIQLLYGHPDARGDTSSGQCVPLKHFTSILIQSSLMSSVTRARVCSCVINCLTHSLVVLMVKNEISLNNGIYFAHIWMANWQTADYVLNVFSLTTTCASHSLCQAAETRTSVSISGWTHTNFCENSQVFSN